MSTKIDAFPKIFTIGQRYIKDIFEGSVEITEKLDGSQFAFGKIDGEIVMRSKGRVFEFPDKMFEKAAEQVERVKPLLLEGRLYYGEYLQKTKHNVLAYSNTPTNNICLFGVCVDGVWFPHRMIQEEADVLGFDCVPLVYEGIVSNPEQIKDMLQRESYLGGAKIEGVVVKNYAKPIMVGDQIISIMCGKYVSEEFKEVHKSDWKMDNTARGGWDKYCESYASEARWHKAIQHLKENGTGINNSPKDIGPLIKEIHRDIIEEQKEDIKEVLWDLFGKDLVRKSTYGFPEWYKEKLLNEAFTNNN